MNVHSIRVTYPQRSLGTFSVLNKSRVSLNMGVGYPFLGLHYKGVGHIATSAALGQGDYKIVEQGNERCNLVPRSRDESNLEVEVLEPIFINKPHIMHAAV